jgi:hypothetical protein
MTKVHSGFSGGLLMRGRAQLGLAISLLTILAAPLLGQPGDHNWIRLASNDVELYTSNSETDARVAFEALSEAQSYFNQAELFHLAPAKKLRVIAFDSAEEYAAYRLSPNSFAHYLHGRGKDYIVLQDIQPQHLQAAIHEYTHFAVRQAGFILPVWLNEGIAECYSSMQVRGTEFTIGEILPERVTTLREQPWIDLDSLLTANQASPYLADSRRVSMFYAQSWALSRMLVLDPRYSRHFPEFLNALTAGITSNEAFQRIYGKQIREVAEDLATHVSGAIKSLPLITVTVPRQVASVTVSLLSVAEKTTLLAGLMASHPKTAAAARAMLNLEPANDSSMESQEIRGILDVQDGIDAEALRHLELAVQLGSKNPEVLYRYAELQAKFHVPDTTALALLEQVVSSAPADDDAKFNLAILQFNRAQYQKAQTTLSDLRNVKSEWRYTLYSILAYCAAQNQESARAASFANLAKTSSRSSKERLEAERFLNYLISTAELRTSNN